MSKVDDIIKKRKEKGLKPARRQSKLVHYPHGAETEYSKRLKQFIDVFYDTVERLVDPQIDDLVTQANIMRGDSFMRLDNISKQVEKLLASLQFAFEREAESPERIASSVMSEIFSSSEKQYNEAIKSLFALDIFSNNQSMTMILEQTISNSTGMMKNIESDNLNKVRQIVNTGIIEGKTSSQIKDDLVKSKAVARRRAENIARNETGNAYAAINKARNKALGVKKFKWITSNDERVRPEHQSFNNKIYTFTRPPNGLMPGEDYNCRCVYSIVIEEEED